MIKYRENENDIVQSVEIDLTEIPRESRQELENKVTKYLKHEGKNIFKFEAGDTLVYETEVLIPKVNKDRLNVLMVLGNPAVHSVAEGMFFSYERRQTKEGKETWLEHRFWRALRDCGILKFKKDLENPTPANIDKINKYKRDCLLNGDYISDFNIFLLPYFSFPTPASGACNGVNGIRKIVGNKIFARMKEFEFQRFEGIILGNDIKNVVCFQRSAWDEIKAQTRYEHITLYYAGTTRLLHTNEGKKKLKGIVSDIRIKK